MMKEFKRTALIVIVAVIALALFMSGIYETFASPIQLILLKTALVSTGLIVAHIARKLFFGEIDWSNDDNWQHFLIVLAFYVIIPYCFAMGG